MVNKLYFQQEIKQLELEITTIEEKIDLALSDYLHNKPKENTPFKKIVNQKLLQSRIKPLKSLIRKKNSRLKILQKKLKTTNKNSNTFPPPKGRGILGTNYKDKEVD